MQQPPSDSNPSPSMAAAGAPSPRPPSRNFWTEPPPTVQVLSSVASLRGDPRTDPNATDTPNDLMWALLRGALDNMAEGVVVADAQGRFVCTNPAVRRLGGGMGTEDFAESCKTFLSFDLSGRQLAFSELPLSRALRGESVADFEMLLRRPDGREFVLVVTAQPIWAVGPTPSGTVLAGAMAVIHDITQQKLAEAQVRRQNSTIQEQAQRQSRMLAALNRRIRGPLNSVMVLNHMLRRHLRPHLTSEAVASLEGMELGIRSTVSLLTDVAELLRLEGTGSPTGSGVVGGLTEFDPAELIRECVAAAQSLAASRGLFLLAPPADVSQPRRTLLSDRVRLRRVITLLLEHALVRTVDGGVSVLMEQSDQVLRLELQDTGPTHTHPAALMDPEVVLAGFAGSAQAQLDTPPDPVAAAIEPHTRTGDSGLGLALAARLAARLGGKLQADERPGRGAWFVLELPITLSAPTPTVPDNSVAMSLTGVSSTNTSLTNTSLTNTSLTNTSSSLQRPPTDHSKLIASSDSREGQLTNPPWQARTMSGSGSHPRLPTTAPQEPPTES